MSFYDVLLAQDLNGNGENVTVEELNVTENGTFTAPSGKAYSPVNVNVSGGGLNNPILTVAIINRTSGNIYWYSEEMESGTLCQSVGTIRGGETHEVNIIVLSSLSFEGYFVDISRYIEVNFECSVASSDGVNCTFDGSAYIDIVDPTQDASITLTFREAEAEG